MHGEVVKLPSYFTHSRGTVQLGAQTFVLGEKRYQIVKLSTGETVVVAASDLTKFPKHEECPSCKCINVDTVT